MTRQHKRAFTLLELMIALAIAATLVAFAVPSYRNHVARTHRIDAASALYRAAQFVERAASDGAATLPPGLDQTPQFGTPIYRLQVLPADDTNGAFIALSHRWSMPKATAHGRYLALIFSHSLLKSPR